jgi:hypothetical protein
MTAIACQRNLTDYGVEQPHTSEYSCIGRNNGRRVMASIWSRNTENVIKTPGLYAFGSVLFAWTAGLGSSDLIHRIRMHNAEALDFSCLALLLAALSWSYPLVRTIRQLSAGRSPSPSPVRTK